MSLAIGLGGILLGVYFYLFVNKYAGIGVGYFALMEVIQFLQYSVIDKCDDPWNKFLTNLGYLHICFQPLFWNIWLFAFVKKPFFIFAYMSIAAGFLLLCGQPRFMDGRLFRKSAKYSHLPRKSGIYFQ